VIAACVDQANVTAAFVAGHLGLPAPYSVETAQKIADKRTMKAGLAGRGVPMPAFRLLARSAHVNRLAPGFPLVIKPIDCGGSKGVRKVDDHRALQLAIDEAFKVTHADEILVEEYCEGVEVAADCFVRDGKAQLLLLRKKHVRSAGLQSVLANCASVGPAEISPAARQMIDRAVEDVVEEFRLRTTPLLVQFIVNGDDVRVIEFAPRVGGGMNFRLVLLHTGIDIVDATVDAYLNRPPTLKAVGCTGFIAANHVYADPGRFGAVCHHDRLLQESIVEEFYRHKSRGAEIGLSFTAADRVASFIVRAATTETLLGKVREAMQRLDVVDLDGRSIVRRDMCLQSP
jgi:biotin carboxylase